MKSKILGLLALGLLVGPGLANAALVTYNFEAPVFVSGATTPLLDRAPNIGDSGFQTDFTTSGGGVMQIGSFVPNPLLSGQTLFSFAGASTVLTLLFSSPIDSIAFDFGIEVSGSSLRISAAGTSLDFLAGNVGGTFQGGTASWLFASPVSMLSIGVITPTGGGSGFAIDDLTLNSVPEPGTLALIGFGLAGLGLSRRRKAN